MIRPLSPEDLAERRAEVDRMFGDDPSDCGGWTWDPPCGGCIRCAHMMVSHYFYKERERADLFQAAGFEFAPRVEGAICNSLPLGSFADKHDGYGCWTAGEVGRDKIIFPWGKVNR